MSEIAKHDEALVSIKHLIRDQKIDSNPIYPPYQLIADNSKDMVRVLISLETYLLNILTEDPGYTPGNLQSEKLTSAGRYALWALITVEVAKLNKVFI